MDTISFRCYVKDELSLIYFPSSLNNKLGYVPKEVGDGQGETLVYLCRHA
jgi:hypothetical protein